MRETGAPAQKIDLLTLIGLVLLLDPLLTILHEVVGHGGACLLTGGTVKALGAHSVDCASATVGDTRIVALAGAAADMICGAACYLLWRFVTKPLFRTALWMAVVTKLLLAAGYLLFSGVLNVGDFSIGAGRPLGRLPDPDAWRIGFALVGLAGYIFVIQLARRMLREMLGGGAAIFPAQRRIPLTLYFVTAVVTLLTAVRSPAKNTALLSLAATFGGLAGLVSVAFRQPPVGEPQAFVIPRSWPVIVAGTILTAAFVLVLGASIRLA